MELRMQERSWRLNCGGWRKTLAKCHHRGVCRGSPSLVQQQENKLITNPPKHSAEIKTPVNLGIKQDEEVPLKKDGTPDKRFKKE